MFGRGLKNQKARSCEGIEQPSTVRAPFTVTRCGPRGTKTASSDFAGHARNGKANSNADVSATRLRIGIAGSIPRFFKQNAREFQKTAAVLVIDGLVTESKNLELLLEQPRLQKVVGARVRVLPLSVDTPGAIIDHLQPTVALPRVMVDLKRNSPKVSSTGAFERLLHRITMFLDGQSVSARYDFRCATGYAPSEDEAKRHPGELGIEVSLILNRGVHHPFFDDDRGESPILMLRQDTYDGITIGLLVLCGMKGVKIVALL
jgi:hypothetical protein